MSKRKWWYKFKYQWVPSTVGEWVLLHLFGVVGLIIALGVILMFSVLIKCIIFVWGF